MRILLFTAASSLLLPACGAGSLPPAPARLTTGIAIYSDINYLGVSAQVSADIPDLRAFASDCVEVDTRDDPQFTVGSRTWTNCLSSVAVAAGYRAILYANPHYRGARFETSGGVSDMRLIPGPCDGTMNDCVSSIQVVQTAASK